MEPLTSTRKRGGGYTSKMLKTGQTTQYDGEQDDGALEKGIAKAYTLNNAGAQSGTSNVDLVHLEASAAVSFDAATKEIRGTGLMGVFKAAGGETIVVTGSASNDGVYTSAAGGSADKIVVTGTLTDESAGAAVSIAKREAIYNNTVTDNNTGLEWLCYRSTKLGAAGDGKFPWSGVPYDVFAYAAAANAANLGGHNDWRVPNVLEVYNLISFENGGLVGPFSWDNTVQTSTARCDTTVTLSEIFYVRVDQGLAYCAAKTTARSAALVRGGD